MTQRTFEHTRKALEHYDFTAPTRAMSWDYVECADDVMACEAADKEALDLVREAFYLDTHDINSKDNCMRVDIDFMRKMAGANNG